MTDDVGDVTWVKSEPLNVAKGLDERSLLRVYRFCKMHYEFWVGLVVGVVLVLFVIK